MSQQTEARQRTPWLPSSAQYINRLLYYQGIPEAEGHFWPNTDLLLEDNSSLGKASLCQFPIPQCVGSKCWVRRQEHGIFSIGICNNLNASFTLREAERVWLVRHLRARSQTSAVCPSQQWDFTFKSRLGSNSHFPCRLRGYEHMECHIVWQYVWRLMHSSSSWFTSALKTPMTFRICFWDC